MLRQKVVVRVERKCTVLAANNRKFPAHSRLGAREGDCRHQFATAHRTIHSVCERLHDEVSLAGDGPIRQPIHALAGDYRAARPVKVGEHVAPVEAVDRRADTVLTLHARERQVESMETLLVQSVCQSRDSRLEDYLWNIDLEALLAAKSAPRTRHSMAYQPFFLQQHFKHSLCIFCQWNTHHITFRAQALIDGRLPLPIGWILIIELCVI